MSQPKQSTVLAWHLQRLAETMPERQRLELRETLAHLFDLVGHGQSRQQVEQIILSALALDI